MQWPAVAMRSGATRKPLHEKGSEMLWENRSSSQSRPSNEFGNSLSLPGPAGSWSEFKIATAVERERSWPLVPGVIAIRSSRPKMAALAIVWDKIRSITDRFFIHGHSTPEQGEVSGTRKILNAIIG